MELNRAYQNKIAGFLSKAATYCSVPLLCLVLITVVAANAYSQNAESNFAVVISTVNKSGEQETTAMNKFKFGETVSVKVEITNLSDKVINVPQGIGFSRPVLFRDGRPVPYTKQVSDQFSKGDGGLISNMLFPKPNQSQTEILDLNDFYEPLKPGRYQLSLERRFFKTGKIHSNAVTFEIEEKDSKEDFKAAFSSKQRRIKAEEAKTADTDNKEQSKDRYNRRPVIFYEPEARKSSRNENRSYRCRVRDN
jgi:hypothetical protein